MRVFKVKGYRKKVRLPEWAYKRLLKRFDVKNAKKDKDLFAIEVPCICDCYNGGNYGECGSCPFEMASGGNYGCVDILRKAGLKPPYVNLGFFDITWKINDDALAREELQAIHTALLKIPRI